MFPEMRFPEPGSVPPIVLPIAEKTSAPVAFGIAAVPEASVPM